MTEFNFTTTILRKQDDLPRFVMVPSEAVSALDQTAGKTFVVLCAIDAGVPFRRSVKPWGDGRWFLDLTDPQCTAAGVDTGDEIAIALSLAEQIPEILMDEIVQYDLLPVWESLRPSDQRNIAEHIFAAKKPETAARRAAKIIARLQQMT